MTPGEALLALCKRLGIRVGDRGGRGGLHGEPTWDGASLRWPLRGVLTKRAPEHWLAHEIGHWLVAPPEWRTVPNYGFQRDPHSQWDPDQIRPEFDREHERYDPGASEDEEALALWLGILVGHACGLDADEACSELTVTAGDFDGQKDNLARLAELGLIAPGPEVVSVGRWQFVEPGVG